MFREQYLVQYFDIFSLTKEDKIINVADGMYILYMVTTLNMEGNIREQMCHFLHRKKYDFN